MLQLSTDASECSRKQCNGHGRCVNHWAPLSKTGFLHNVLQILKQLCIVRFNQTFINYIKTIIDYLRESSFRGEDIRHCDCFKGWTGNTCQNQDLNVVVDNSLGNNKFKVSFIYKKCLFWLFYHHFQHNFLFIAVLRRLV